MTDELSTEIALLKLRKNSSPKEYDAMTSQEVSRLLEKSDLGFPTVGIATGEYSALQKPETIGFPFD
jgi:hypothetical protein